MGAKIILPFICLLLVGCTSTSRQWLVQEHKSHIQEDRCMKLYGNPWCEK